MLQCQNGSGNQDGHLFAVGNGFESGPNGDFRFPETHIATHQPVHGMRLFHVFFDIDCGFQLIRCVFVNETGLQFVLQVGIGIERKSFLGFSFSIQFNEVACYVFDFRLGFVFQSVPGTGPQFVQRRSTAVTAYIF